MTTRTKIGLCAGLVVVLAVGVVVVRPTKPGVKLSFVRYYEDGPAVLTLTNRGESLVTCIAGNVFLYSERRDQNRGFVTYFEVLPRGGTQLVAYPQPSGPFEGSAERFLAWLRTSEFPTPVSVRCVPQPSMLRRSIELLLSRVGIGIASTGFVATVDLPAR
ncbi:MAG TPA: hypothetical protein VNU68_32800 [Verrucomicrobiae bacterium]|nr:hypothetical protein [Verrucomicrobiae bacterium]